MSQYVTRRTQAALARAIAEHGAPNRFYLAELQQEHGAPSPMLQGRYAQSLKQVDVGGHLFGVRYDAAYTPRSFSVWKL